ncbi:hypothetical protein [Arthrobacter woluwensis]|uniref:Uncharacterized protein n=1 Tax=Arthrobacter woluwensis TaxID=156980 RepID=A0A1H4R8M0_9MICC|nr:hypothetical protein [Arthrobacter woluwensis]SEC28187.1 hypothetical protein SAMN04489745_2489 [Arthrobacter woluwensis]
MVEEDGGVDVTNMHVEWATHEYTRGWDLGGQLHDVIEAEFDQDPAYGDLERTALRLIADFARAQSLLERAARAHGADDLPGNCRPTKQDRFTDESLRRVGAWLIKELEVGVINADYFHTVFRAVQEARNFLAHGSAWRPCRELTEGGSAPAFMIAKEGKTYLITQARIRELRAGSQWLRRVSAAVLDTAEGRTSHDLGFIGPRPGEENSAVRKLLKYAKAVEQNLARSASAMT